MPEKTEGYKSVVKKVQEPVLYVSLIFEPMQRIPLRSKRQELMSFMDLTSF